MPRRQHLTVVAAGLGLSLLAGCSAGVQVDAYPRETGTDLTCDTLFADVPQTVAGQERRQVRDDVAVAWGDPEIILRCGVSRPAALTATSQCNEVSGVGWLDETTSDGFLFTTIGRAAYVSVEVPEEVQPPADVLVDLAAAVQRHVPEEQPCV